MQWLTDFFARRRFAKEERAKQHDLHKVRRTWIASGVVEGRNGRRQDAGVWEIPNATRDEAIATIARLNPKSVVLNVTADPETQIYMITYRVAS